MIVVVLLLFRCCLLCTVSNISWCVWRVRVCLSRVNFAVLQVVMFVQEADERPGLELTPDSTS
jgi:hypothetical protein